MDTCSSEVNFYAGAAVPTPTADFTAGAEVPKTFGLGTVPTFAGLEPNATSSPPMIEPAAAKPRTAIPAELEALDKLSSREKLVCLDFGRISVTCPTFVNELRVSMRVDQIRVREGARERNFRAGCVALAEQILGIAKQSNRMLVRRVLRLHLYDSHIRWSAFGIPKPAAATIKSYLTADLTAYLPRAEEAISQIVQRSQILLLAIDARVKAMGSVPTLDVK